MRTTNGLERLNKELKRRTRVATLFPNTASCTRLISAMLAEQDEEWMTAKSLSEHEPLILQLSHNSLKPEHGNLQKESCAANGIAVMTRDLRAIYLVKPQASASAKGHRSLNSKARLGCESPRSTFRKYGSHRRREYLLWLSGVCVLENIDR